MERIHWFGLEEQLDAGERALTRCVGDVASFLDPTGEIRPFVRSGIAGSFHDLLSLAIVDSLVTERQVRLPALRMALDGEPLPPDELPFAAVEVGHSIIGDVVDPARVLDGFGKGGTIVLQGLQHWWPPIKEFCRSLSIFLSHRVQANAYVTPAGRAGLGRHYDTHDVVVMQFQGTKRWRVYGPVLESPLRMQAWGSIGGGNELPETPLEFEVELSDGDCLYLPSGWIHEASAGDGASGHITLGILPTTYESAIRRYLSDAAISSPDLRQRLPFGFATPARSGEVSSSLDETLVRTNLDPGEIQRLQADSFWAGVGTPFAGRVVSLATGSEICGQTIVKRMPGLVLRACISDDTVALRIDEREIVLPAEAYEILPPLLDGPPVRLDSLGGLDDQSIVVVVRRLVREGLLVTV